MDKKQLHALIDGIVDQVSTDNELSEAEARVFVGVALRQNKAAFLQTVNIPTLQIAGPAIAEAPKADEETSEITKAA